MSRNLSISEMAPNFRSYSNLFIWYFLINFHVVSVFISAENRITRGQSVRDGEEIISKEERFVLGFFSPVGSDFRYVGIWYNKVENQSVVWVANRENPISGNGGDLRIGNDGNLIILNENGDMIWSTNATVASDNSTAVLMDTGNLVLFGSGDPNKASWKSFDHSTDTFLPSMRVYMNVSEVERHVFTSWRSASDPRAGKYSLGIDPRGSPQIVIWEGTSRKWRSGNWNGLIFVGVPGMRAIYLYGFKLNTEGDGRLYFTYTPSNSTDLIRFWIRWDGTERQERWNAGLDKWDLIQSHPVDEECDQYNKCGPFGKCDMKNRPACSCIQGFVPQDLDQWSRGNWSGGCTRKKKLECLSEVKRDGFFKAERVKLPDFVDYVGSEDIKQCENKCLENCSCTAYAFVSGINCMIWSRELVDIEQFAEGGSTLFIRLDRSELGGKSKVTKIVIVAVVLVGIICLSASIWLCMRKLKFGDRLNKTNNEMPKVSPSGEFSSEFSGPVDLSVEGQPGTSTELALFNFSCLAVATNNFSDENKLGQGGFGRVYKGMLPGNQEIAVKRLSIKSSQGLEEFKNEITLMAKLQHRNLVRLLGCCIQVEEKIIIYEYMPNKSLDSFLFDPAKKAQIDWRKRFAIIEGIARGILYLHRDSRLRIIHRDLKASNILLDEEMNPKISDFGMARIFGGNQNEANTNRVVGTYGYMAPEYAMEGLFSVKSDVYSFGVLLLEIVSGRRNTSFRSTDHSNIIGYAWDLWDEGRAIELVDPSIVNLCSRKEVLRCIHVGMLCIQDMANHRPNMPAVVLMLESENATLPLPRQPTFTSMRHSGIKNADMWNGNHDVVSSNNVTISVILGR
ncbi:G-type lectin S-receptor-like serine threonine-kinase B120 [Olea europaea subsp. europaea]|uniref:Receptor-like serine/threonine-protein kinase n=1 Tax=Olea europaea subsp. europaea TaxID=158383 RepID=A0A8S0UMT6_OLEEU|nr:G-type lectin S-receptor-like serine threonine-kinase B120 [Olea europaea subsp. europaea]